MIVQACCICSARLDTYDVRSEKAIVPDRHLSCCDRIVCTRCINQNHRYRSYCPYCQISTSTSVLPQGLRDPPAYSAETPSSSDLDLKKHTLDDDDLPPYSAHLAVQPPAAKSPDVLHFLTPTDTLASLSLAYGVPIPILRRTNNLFADNLLLGRKTLLIPGSHYSGGVSLSPAPLEGTEEDARKTAIRRFMVRAKCAEYDVAVLYLQQASGDLDAAVGAYEDDERWEREHPISGKAKGKNAVGAAGMRRFVGTGARRRPD